MSNKKGILLAVILSGTVFGTKLLWPSVRVIEGPPVQTIIDVSDSTRDAYEDRVQRLQDDLEDAMSATPPINTTDTLWRDSVRTVQLACVPAPTDSTPVVYELPPAWYLTTAAFPDSPGEGLASELMIGVGGGLLTQRTQLRELYMPGPVTGIAQGPQGMQYAFGQWPAPHCRFKTKVEWGLGAIILKEALELLIPGGGGSSTDINISTSPDDH